MWSQCHPSTVPAQSAATLASDDAPSTRGEHYCHGEAGSLPELCSQLSSRREGSSEYFRQLGIDFHCFVGALRVANEWVFCCFHFLASIFCVIHGWVEEDLTECSANISIGRMVRLKECYLISIGDRLTSPPPLIERQRSILSSF